MQPNASVFLGELNAGKVKLFFPKLTRRGFAQVSDTRHRWTLAFRKQDGKWKLSGIYLSFPEKMRQGGGQPRKQIPMLAGPTKLAAQDGGQCKGFRLRKEHNGDSHERVLFYGESCKKPRFFLQ